MERVLKLHQQYQPNTKPVLEINTSHPLIQKMSEMKENQDDFEDAGKLLLDQAKIIQGSPLQNPADFARRMAEFMRRAL